MISTISNYQLQEIHVTINPKLSLHRPRTPFLCLSVQSSVRPSVTTAEFGPKSSIREGTEYQKFVSVGHFTLFVFTCT